MGEYCLKKLEKIYKEIAEEDKRLAEDFMLISFVDFKRLERSFKGVNGK